MHFQIETDSVHNIGLNVMLNFLGIGAQKCATSWLYHTLSIHPKVAFPSGKEVHFWNNRRGRDVEWYQQLFSNSTTINGEITPAYATLPDEVIQEIYDSMPYIRLVYLIRNPIERAWSSARMALGRAEMMHEDASDQWFIDHFNSQGSLARGDYEKCIRQWLNVFPSSQLLIIRYESIINDPVVVANTVLNHLGLEGLFKDLDNDRLKEIFFEGDSVPIRSSLIPVLEEIYGNRIASLQKYLNEDLSDWIK